MSALKRTVRCGYGTPLCVHFGRQNHTKVAIVGSGTGAMACAGHLLRKRVVEASDIAVFDDSPKHYYQPAFTMVASGLLGDSDCQVSQKAPSLLFKPTASVFDSSVRVVVDRVADFQPESNCVYLKRSGDKHTYDYLIVATGICLRYDLIEGALQALADPSQAVGSVHRLDYARKMNKFRATFKGGRILATQPPMPVKGVGAAHNWVYLMEEHLRANGLRDDSQILFHSALPSMFHVKHYSDALHRIALEKGIKTTFNANLTKIDGLNQKAFFEMADGSTVVESYDLLHCVPPQKPFAEMVNAPFCDRNGFVEVNQFTLQSTHFGNVFALGDCSSVPTDKTVAATLSQAAVVASNVERMTKGYKVAANYDGYTSSAIFVGDDKLLLAEYLFDDKLSETFHWNQAIPRRAMYHWRKKVLPFAYWNLTAKGRWFGRELLRAPAGYHLGLRCSEQTEDHRETEKIAK